MDALHPLVGRRDAFQLLPDFLDSFYSLSFNISIAYFEKVTFEIFWIFALLPSYCCLGPPRSRHLGTAKS